eukprot:1346598-Pleurochrysis_carterae.AAC.1
MRRVRTHRPRKWPRPKRDGPRPSEMGRDSRGLQRLRRSSWHARKGFVNWAVTEQHARGEVWRPEIGLGQHACTPQASGTSARDRKY